MASVTLEITENEEGEGNVQMRADPPLSLEVVTHAEEDAGSIPIAIAAGLVAFEAVGKFFGATPDDITLHNAE